MTNPHVAAVVLNWNNYEDTAECIRSLLALSYDNLEIVAVDNGSTDDSVRRIRESFPEITVSESAVNRGFGGGINLGIETALESGTEYVWLLNNDVVCQDRNLLTSLVDRLEAHGEIGVITPIITRFDTSDIWFKRGIIDETAGDGKHVSTPEWTPYDDDLLRDGYVPTTCALYRATVFDRIGLFPEEYFLYYEDVDHCYRMRDRFDIVTDSTVTVEHKKSASTGGSMDPIYSYYIVRNRWLFASRRLDVGREFYQSYGRWVLRRLRDQIRAGPWSDTDAALATIRGVTDALRGKTGRGPYP